MKQFVISGVILLCVLWLSSLSACSDGGADCTGCECEAEIGNEWGIGAYCTIGGGECADTPSRAAPFCTVDSDETAPAFCTRPCAVDADCGTGAVCESDTPNGPKGCFPLFCE